jgi:hypothetical protein
MLKCCRTGLQHVASRGACSLHQTPPLFIFRHPRVPFAHLLPPFFLAPTVHSPHAYRPR